MKLLACRSVFLVAMVVGSSSGAAVACAFADDPSEPMDAVSRTFLRPTRTLVELRAPDATSLIPVQFAGADDTVLRGTLYDRERASRVVLVVGGISGNHTWYGAYAEVLTRAGFDVLLFDGRGYGTSDGVANAAMLVEDARAALHYLRDARGYAARDIAVFGISLGSILALAVAAAEQPRAVIVEDLFLPNELFERLKKRLTGTALGRLASIWVERTLLPAVDPIANARAFRGPMLFVTGSADPISKPAATIRVANACARPSRLWIAPHAGHAPEVLLAYDLEYAAQLSAFLLGAFDAVPSPHVEVAIDRRSPPPPGLARIRVTSSAATVAQITLTDSTHFEFEVREVPAGTTEISMRRPFAATHVFASIVHHTTRRPDGTYEAERSPFAASMAGATRFEQRVDAVSARLDPRLASAAAAAELVSRIEDDLPDPSVVHPAVRPRYAARLAALADVLLVTETPDALAFAQHVCAFLPEHPEAWTGYGKNGFIGGFRDAACADLCVRLARLVAKNGDAQAAARFARLAPLLKP